MWTRRQLLHRVGLGSLAVATGCTGGSDSTDESETTQSAVTTGAPTDTTATTTEQATGGADSAEQAVTVLFERPDAGDVEAVERLSVGFEDLGAWSSDATLYRTSEGDTLATQLVQGDATARHAYENFAPDGEYVEVAGVDVGSLAEGPFPVSETSDATLSDRFAAMAGPSVEALRKAEPSLQFRINLEGNWYDAETTTFVLVLRIDGRWYVSTGITPWRVVVDSLPDDWSVPPERTQKIRQTVTLPLGSG